MMFSTTVARQAEGLTTYKRRSLKPGIRVVAVASGKGGVGKTLFSVNASLALGDMGYNVLLLDGDLAMANAAILLGERPHHGLEDVARGTCSLDEAALRVDERLTVLTSGADRAALAARSGRVVGRLLHHFRYWKHPVDFLVIDTAAGAAEDVVHWALAAGELAVVVTPEPTSITDAYMLCEVIRRAGFEGDVGVVVNMAGSLEGSQVFNSFSRMLDTYLGMEPTYLGNVPPDREVTRAIRTHRPVLRQSPGSAASRRLVAIARTMADWREGKHTLLEALGAWARRLTRLEALGDELARGGRT